MRAISSGAAKEIEALGIAIIPPEVAIGIAVVFAGLMLLFFLKNRQHKSCKYCRNIFFIL